MQSTLKFLSALKKNNNREWFEANKEKYLASKAETEVLLDKLIAGLIKFDKRISKDLIGKDYIFRIYKDVRFSKDKIPYKTNMGASISPGGRKTVIPGYYIHVEPNNCFLAGGLYGPEPDMLKAVRQEIDYNGAKFVKVLKSKPFSNYYKGLDDWDVLKTVPKGFDKENKYLEFLKNRHFIVSTKIKDKDLENPAKLLAAFKAMYPFLEYLRQATEK
ncbi:MAG: DUF2461 domain-containing protein [Bacteroidota bacterium]|nr:DUF2461 domain-containing protein [Bacteroidota bacterium]